MRGWLIILLLAVFYSSCGLLKNTKSNVERLRQESEYKSETKLVNYKDWSRTTGSLNLYSDSSLQTYAVRLWPKGSFTFSADQGFSGEADSVVILRSLKGGSTAAAVLNIKEQDKGKVEIKAASTGKQSTDQKSKVKQQEASWIWVIGILTLVYLLFCLLLYKK